MATQPKQAPLTPQAWQTTYTFLRESGILTGETDPAQAYTTEFFRNDQRPTTNDTREAADDFRPWPLVRSDAKTTSITVVPSQCEDNFYPRHSEAAAEESVRGLALSPNSTAPLPL